MIALAGSASADIPVGWSDPAPVPVLHDILLLLGIPLLITAGIVAAIYLPGVIRGEKVAPAGARTDDEWFGGRRPATELDGAGSPRALEGAEGSTGDRDPGGAGGSW